jgi:Zn-dependent protease with chaperone function
MGAHGPVFRATVLPLLLLALVLLGTLLRPSPSFAAPPDEPSSAQIELDEHGHVRVPEASPEALAWYRGGNVRWALAVLLGLLVPLTLLFTGRSARLRAWALRVAGKPWRATVLYLIAYALIVFLIELPLDYWGGYVRPHAFGLSNQTLGKWIADTCKGLGLAIVALCLFVPGTLYFVRKSPTRWWLWTSLVATPIVCGLLVLWPVFIDPLFNDFGPMSDPALEAEILALAERAGIEGSRVFEVDKSLDTNAINAYVTGLGATKRIVLWDTIIAKLPRDELLVVMGHELGHYVLGHVRNSMLLALLAIPLTLWLFHVCATWSLARFGERFGFDSLADVAALPLFFLLTGLFGFVGAPLTNAWSRWQEHESDRFALELTHANQACARAFVQLADQNLGNPRPGPLFVLWRASHPPLADRIEFCNSYRPWETGEPQAYVDRFTPP